MPTAPPAPPCPHPMLQGRLKDTKAMGRFLTEYLRRDGRDSETVTAALQQDSLQVGRVVAAQIDEVWRAEPAGASCCSGQSMRRVPAGQAEVQPGAMCAHHAPPHHGLQGPFALVNTTVALTAADLAAGK